MKMNRAAQRDRCLLGEVVNQEVFFPASFIMYNSEAVSNSHNLLNKTMHRSENKSLGTERPIHFKKTNENENKSALIRKSTGICSTHLGRFTVKLQKCVFVFKSSLLIFCFQKRYFKSSCLSEFQGIRGYV